MATRPDADPASRQRVVVRPDLALYSLPLLYSGGLLHPSEHLLGIGLPFRSHKPGGASSLHAAAVGAHGRPAASSSSQQQLLAGASSSQQLAASSQQQPAAASSRNKFILCRSVATLLAHMLRRR